jgi:MFS transporter, AAHS family, 4-hydroxybenzoate transporter
MAQEIDVQDFINAHPYSAFQKRILVLCFLVVALDGFDTALVGFIAPAVQSAWSVGPAELTPLMMAGLFGLLIGSFVFGPLSDRFGRKKLLVITTALFGIMSVAAGFSENISQLTALRFLTGLGLGGALPNAITLCSEYSPDQRRASLVALMVCGFTVGMAASGVIATAVIPTLGWQSVLFIGGALPLLLVPMLIAMLPESANFMALVGNRTEQIWAALNRIAPGKLAPETEFKTLTMIQGAPARQIFAEGYGAGTLLLWCGFFMSLLIVYLVGNWLPLILTESGVAKSTAGLVTTGFHLGGSVGAIVLGRLMDRFDENKVLGASYAMASIVILLISLASGTVALVAAGVFAAGFCISGAQVGLNAMASGYYPTSARGTGVSWANGIGRMGSIVGSLIGGTLLAVGWGASSIFLLLAVPALMASAAIFAMGRARRNLYTSITGNTFLGGTAPITEE